MYEYEVNYLAILVSAIAFFGLGALWYGPLFGKQWMNAMGWTEDSLEADKSQSNMPLSFGLMFLGSLIMSFVTAHMVPFMLYIYPDMSGLSAGLVTGLTLWFGYVFAYLLTAPAFENRPWSYVLVNGGYWLTGIVLVGIIVGLWL
jgi:hypothetical protein